MKLICITLTVTTYAQNDKSKTTEGGNQVIVLDLADSMGISIHYNTRNSVTRPNQRFELISKKPVVFKILNINPLRYNFFLNDELVTNFFESGSIAVPNGTTVNGVNTVKEIPAINIFNFEIVTETDIEEKIMVRDLKKDIENLKVSYNSIADTLDKIDREIAALPSYIKYYHDGPSKIPPKDLKIILEKLKKFDDASIAYEASERKLAGKISDVQNIINASSNKDIKILKDRTENREYTKHISLANTIDQSVRQYSDLKTELEKLDRIVDILQILNIKPNERKYIIANKEIANSKSEIKQELYKLLHDFRYLYEKN